MRHLLLAAGLLSVVAAPALGAPKPPPAPPKVYHLVLTGQDIQEIGLGLQSRPLGEALPVWSKLNEQLISQVGPSKK